MVGEVRGKEHIGYLFATCHVKGTWMLHKVAMTEMGRSVLSLSVLLPSHSRFVPEVKTRTVTLTNVDRLF